MRNRGSKEPQSEKVINRVEKGWAGEWPCNVFIQSWDICIIE